MLLVVSSLPNISRLAAQKALCCQLRMTPLASGPGTCASEALIMVHQTPRRPASAQAEPCDDLCLSALLQDHLRRASQVSSAVESRLRQEGRAEAQAHAQAQAQALKQGRAEAQALAQAEIQALKRSKAEAQAAAQTQIQALLQERDDLQVMQSFDLL